jgi:uncharacterized protein YqgV (UPF0045/DUF77 family)
VKEAVIAIHIFVPTGDDKVSKIHRHKVERIRLKYIDNDINAMSTKLKAELHKIKENIEE